jgi:hypothetical protein
MNPFMFILFVFINTILLNSSIDNLFNDYQPLYYPILKTLIITNPCHTDQSILIRNHSIYKFHHQKWKQLYVSKKLFHIEKISIVNSIAYLNNDLILIINGNLFQTQDIISSSIDQNIIYRLIRYSSKLK